jgi:hypothetical protein
MSSTPFIVFEFDRSLLQSEPKCLCSGQGRVGVGRDILIVSPIFVPIFHPRMRLSPERCLRVPLRSSFFKSRTSWINIQESTRGYAKTVNPYTTTIALPKTDYELWPRHDKIRDDFMTKCVDDCYKWQVSCSCPSIHSTYE